jgi:hypothetical protein
MSDPLSSLQSCKRGHLPGGSFRTGTHSRCPSMPNSNRSQHAFPLACAISQHQFGPALCQIHLGCEEIRPEPQGFAKFGQCSQEIALGCQRLTNCIVRIGIIRLS